MRQFAQWCRGAFFPNSITANEIAAGTITASEIEANTITANEIAANTITAAEIAANTVTAAEIAANTITASEIAANTITAAEIAANTVTAAEIAANTVTASEIAATTITGAEINATFNLSTKTLTADTGTVGGWTLAAGSLSSGNVTIDATNEEFRMGAATDPTTGVGIFVGQAGTSSQYDLRAGDPAGEYIWWDHSAGSVNVSGVLNLTNSSSTFTPAWAASDFGTDPSGSVSYLNLGAVVIMYRLTNLVGDSSANTMTWDAGSIPAAIRPSGNIQVPCLVVDNNITKGGIVQINSGGGATFFLQSVSGSHIVLDAAGFATSGSPNKGLAAGWTIVYPK